MHINNYFLSQKKEDKMFGIESSYCNLCIQALIGAWRALMECSATEALTLKKYGKNDTLGLDARPEIIIKNRINGFDPHAILVTEELNEVAWDRWPTDADPIRQPLMLFSDPTDRSKQLKEFFEIISKDRPTARIGELMKEQNSLELWETTFEKPAAITGATSSITCVRKGEIIFSVIVNYITQTVFVATQEGVFYLALPDYNDRALESIDLAHIHSHGKILLFPPAGATCKKPDDYFKFVTFLGKTGYRENFDDCMIFVEKPDRYLHHQQPGGPARILYLSELQKNFGPVGFIMANGEKIGEWIHWLAFVKFAKNHDGGAKLRVYEICIDRPWVKDGVLMSTPEPYSIFHCTGGHSYLDISELRKFPWPNRFRSMLVVLPADNERIICIMNEHEYREISMSF